jgi:Domain of unknown function (DUF4365)
MRQMKRSPQTTRSKIGLNHVRTIVENAGCVFIKIDQEDDLGIDGIIELLVDGKSVHKSFAVQIKTGASYFDADRKECIFPVGRHREYWLRHPLPVLGIIFVPILHTAFWFDLKRALRMADSYSTLRLSISRHHIFDQKSFLNIFIPLQTRNKVSLTFRELMRYIGSGVTAEREFGFDQSFKCFPKKRKMWSILISHLREDEFCNLAQHLPFYLAHVPWHGDLGADGSGPVEGTLKEELLRKFASFGRSEILKLLQFIDREEGIARGTMGQCVEAVISAIDQFPSKLQAIVEDRKIDLELREFAVLIHAMYMGRKSLPLLDNLIADKSAYSRDLRSYVECDRLYPYS